MKCDFVPIAEIHRTGRAMVQCKRCKQQGLLPPSGNPKDLDNQCLAWPFLHEVEHWLPLFADAMGITQARAALDVWLLGGGKIEELPAGIQKLTTKTPAAPPAQPPAPDQGPGTELEILLAAHGATGDCGGLCKQWRDRMNIWGVAGCLEHRVEIIERLQTAVYKSWVTEQIRIGWSISKEPWFRFDDPFGCIVDESIRRAEAG